MHSRHRAGPPGSRARRRPIGGLRAPPPCSGSPYKLREGVCGRRRRLPVLGGALRPSLVVVQHGTVTVSCQPSTGSRRTHAAPTSGLPCHGRASLRAGAETSRGQLAAWCRKVARRVCGEGEYARAEVTWVAAHRFPVIVGVQQVALDEILASRFKSSASDLQQSGCSAVSARSAAFCATVTWLQG